MDESFVFPVDKVQLFQDYAARTGWAAYHKKAGFNHIHVTRFIVEIILRR
jgi:hypothetical protein